MADEKRGTDGGVLGRLAGRGEDAVTRLVDELGRNPRVTDALGRAMAGKGKVDEATRRTLGRVGLAAADEIRDLRRRVDKLEQRLAKLEARGTRARSATAKQRATTTKPPGGTATTSPSAGTAPKPQASRSGTAPRPRGGGSSGSTRP
jgi:hypothetical protein